MLELTSNLRITWPAGRPGVSDPGQGDPEQRVIFAPVTLKRSAGRLVLALGAGLLLALIPVTLLGGGGQGSLPLPGIGRPARAGDPFAYIASRAADFEARAVAGSENVVFAKSPGGVLATAERVSAYRGLIDSVTAGTGVDPDTLEAIAFLESAGNPQAIAGPDPAAAAGLTQILAQTGHTLLGMHIDLSRSRRLTAGIYKAYQEGNAVLVERLQRQRASADARFDPRKALAATIRYLQLANGYFGRPDLDVESYHMGIGNLRDVLGAYDGRPVPYVQLFFDTAPDHNAAAYSLLHSFSDDSLLYYWRILAAEEIMRLYRTDRAALVRLASLQTAGASDAEVLHPPDSTPSFTDPGALRAGYANRSVLPLPSNSRALGLAYDPGMGSLAHSLGQPPRLYQGLRPPALDLLIELAARVRALSHSPAIVVASTVSDKRYQDLLGVSAVPTAATGYSFAIERRYASRAQAAALQAMLDQLQALNLIAWVRTPTTIDVTVASDAGKVIVNGP